MRDKSQFTIIRRLQGTKQEYHTIRSREQREDGTYIVLATGKPAYVRKRWQEIFGS